MRFTVPDEQTAFHRVAWGMFALLAIAMAVAAPVAGLRDGELGIARVLGVLAPLFGLIAYGLRRKFDRPPTYVVDVASGSLERRRAGTRQTYALTELGELTIATVTLDRDGPETWYELRAAGIPERLHFTRSRSRAERRARQLAEQVKLHQVRASLQRPALDGGPNRELPSDLGESQRVAGAEVAEMLAKLEHDDDADVARRAKAAREQLVGMRDEKR